MNRMVGCPCLLLSLPLSFRGARSREPQMCNCTSGNLDLQSLDSGFSLTAARNDGQWTVILSHLRAKPLFLLAQFRRQRLAEIFRFENLADFNLVAPLERRALHPFDR